MHLLQWSPPVFMDDSKKAFQSCVFAHIQINPGEEQPYRTSMVIRQGALQKLIFFSLLHLRPRGSSYGVCFALFQTAMFRLEGRHQHWLSCGWVYRSKKRKKNVVKTNQSCGAEITLSSEGWFLPPLPPLSLQGQPVKPLMCPSFCPFAAYCRPLRGPQYTATIRLCCFGLVLVVDARLMKGKEGSVFTGRYEG